MSICNELKCSLANMIGLSVVPEKDVNANLISVATACEKFLRTAALLPFDEFLGWQILVLSSVSLPAPLGIRPQDMARYLSASLMTSL